MPGQPPFSGLHLVLYPVCSVVLATHGLALQQCLFHAADVWQTIKNKCKTKLGKLITKLCKRDAQDTKKHIIPQFIVYF